MGVRNASEYLNSGEIESVVFNPSSPSPAAKEGQISYDSVSKTHTSNNDILDTTLNLGDEQRIRIINKSGSDIADGKPLRQTGVDVATGLPTVDLAQADTIDNALVLCISTHIILDGDEGMGVTSGGVRELNTSLLSPGIIFLDDVSPGEFVNTAPDIATVIGIVTKSDALEGTIFVEIIRLASIPTLFAIMRDIPDVYNLTTSYQDLVNYQESTTIGLNVDLALGTITGLSSGIYRGTFNITITVPTSASTRSFTINIRNTVAAVDAITYVVPIPRDTTEVSRSFAVPFEVAANDILVAQIKSDVAISGVTIDSITFDVESIRARLG